MKTLFITIASFCVLQASAYAAPEVNKKTIETFRVAFKDAEDVTWYAEENYDHVYFTLQNIKTRIKYDKEGNFVSCLRTYMEESLPMLIRIKLKEKYADKKVTSVAELSTNDGTEFHMNLEDEKNIYMIRGDATGSLNLEKKIRKV